MWLVIAMLVVALAVRLVPLRIWQQDPTDLWVNNFRLGVFRQAGGIPRYTPRVDPPTLMAYPWGLTWLLSKLDVRNPLQVGAALNIVVNLISIAASGALAWLLSRHLGLGIEPLVAAQVAVAACVFLPLTFSTWSGVYSLTARPIGALLNNVAAVCLALGLAISPWWYAGVLPCVVLMIYLSKFGMQGLFFAAAGLSVFAASPEPLAAFLAGIAVALLIGGRSAYRILRGHLLHMRFYAGFLQHRHVAVLHRVMGPLELLRQLFRPGLGRRVKLMSVLRTPLVRIVLFVPWLVLLPFVWSPAWGTALGNNLLVLVAVSVALIPVISMRHLRFLGEADRYVTFFGVMPLIALIGVGVPVTGLWSAFAALFAANVAISACYIYVNGKQKRGGRDASRESLISCLNEVAPEERKVLVVPSNLSAALLPFTKCTFVGVYMGMVEGEARERLESLYTEVYPYPRLDFEVLRRSFGVDYLVYAKRQCSREYLLLHGIDERFARRPPLSPIFENGAFEVYDLTTIDGGLSQQGGAQEAMAC